MDLTGLCNLEKSARRLDNSLQVFIKAGLGLEHLMCALVPSLENPPSVVLTERTCPVTSCLKFIKIRQCSSEA